MKSVFKVQFEQLNDKRIYFCDGKVSLTFGHPYLRKNKLKYRNIHSVIQIKTNKSLKEESEVIKKIPRLDTLRQIYNQIPLFCEINSDTNFISSGFMRTKEYIKSGS